MEKTRSYVTMDYRLTYDRFFKYFLFPHQFFQSRTINKTYKNNNDSTFDDFGGDDGGFNDFYDDDNSHFDNNFSTTNDNEDLKEEENNGLEPDEGSLFLGDELESKAMEIPDHLKKIQNQATAEAMKTKTIDIKIVKKKCGEL
eukprot:UN26800